MSLSKPKLTATNLAVLAGTATVAALGVYMYYNYSGPAEKDTGGKTKKTAAKKGSSNIPVEKSHELKEKGNELFKKQDFAQALINYTEAIQEVIKNGMPKDQSFLATLYQNRAAVSFLFCKTTEYCTCFVF